MGQVGVGRVSLSALGSGFGFFDFARVGFRVFGYFLGSPSGRRNIGSGYARDKKFCILQSILAGLGKKLPKFRQRCKKLAIFLKNLLLWVTRVLQNLPQVNSGWLKRPRVGF